MSVNLHPHQKVAVEDLANGKVLRGDPGVGKSFTALAYFFEKECGGTLNDWGSIKTPKDLIIITTAKKRDSGDWQKDCYKLGLMEDPTISVAGIRVTIDSWNQIEKYVGVEDAFIIFDEQRVGGSGKWAKTFVKIAKKNRWILLSGTPGDTWMDYVSVFVANGMYKNITEFKDTHIEYDSWVKFPKIKRYHNVGRLVRNRNALLVEMRYKRHTTRHLEVTVVAHDAETLERVTKKRWNVFENRPLRDAAELFSVARKVVNSDPSRLTKIRDLQQKHKRLIVYYTHNYELEILRTLGSPDTSRHTHPMVADGTLSLASSSPGREAMKTVSGTSSGPNLTLVPPVSTTNDSVKISKPSLTTSSVEGISSLSRIGRAHGSSSGVSTSPKGLSTHPRETRPHNRSSLNNTSTPETEAELLTNNTAWDYLLSLEGLAENSAALKTRVRTKFVETGSGSELKLTNGSTEISEKMSLEHLSDPTESETLDTPGSTELLSASEPSTDAAGIPTHHPEMMSLTELSTTMDSETLPRHLYDRPSTNGPLPEATLAALSQLLSGKTFSVDELKTMSQKSSDQKVGHLTVVGGTSVKDQNGSDENSDTTSSAVTIAEWNGHKHQPVPETDEWIYLVQYRAGAEAWNCTETDAMAFYSMTYSYKDFEQSQGRIDRLNTSYTDLFYYLLISDSWIDKAIKKALDLKQDFNEKRFKIVKEAFNDAVEFFSVSEDLEEAA